MAVCIVGGEVTPLTVTTTLVPAPMVLPALNCTSIVRELALQELALKGVLPLRV